MAMQALTPFALLSNRDFPLRQSRWGGPFTHKCGRGLVILNEVSQCQQEALF